MPEKQDGWFMQRVMRLTWLEKRSINSATRAQRMAQRAGMLLERAPLPAQPQCLEVGCGQGVVTRVLVERFGATVIATDYDPGQLEVAQSRLTDLPAERVELRQADARSLPFDDGVFDLVVAFQVWHHIPGGWREAAAEVSRVLRPGGAFLFTDLVMSPKIGGLVRRLLHIDGIADDTLRDELTRHALPLAYYESKPGFFMKHCEGIAIKNGGITES